MKGGSKVSIEAHRHEGIFIARGKEDALVTKNLVCIFSYFNLLQNAQQACEVAQCSASMRGQHFDQT